MVWCRRGDNLLSEPMMVSLLMHKCVTRPQWVKTLDARISAWYRPNSPEIFWSQRQRGWLSLITVPHHSDVIMSAIASQITRFTIVYSTVYSGADKKQKHKSSASLAFVRGIHRWPVNSPHKGPVTRKMLPFDDVIMFGVYRATFCWPSAPTVMHFALNDVNRQ